MRYCMCVRVCVCARVCWYTFEKLRALTSSIDLMQSSHTVVSRTRHCTSFSYCHPHPYKLSLTLPSHPVRPISLCSTQPWYATPREVYRFVRSSIAGVFTGQDVSEADALVALPRRFFGFAVVLFIFGGHFTQHCGVEAFANDASLALQ